MKGLPHKDGLVIEGRRMKGLKKAKTIQMIT